jgi:hypothetical protein
MVPDAVRSARANGCAATGGERLEPGEAEAQRNPQMGTKISIGMGVRWHTVKFARK